jgi:putative polyketide hydroxylase
MCAQDELEPLLVTTAQALNGELRFGSELTAFEQDNNGVTAHIRARNTGEEHLANAHYLIAADGAGSPIRHMLNVSMRGRGTLAHYVNIYFRADLSTLVQGREFVLCLVRNPEAQGVLLAVNNTDRWIFTVPYAPESQTLEEDFTPERCIERVRKAIGLSHLAIEIINIIPWEAAVRIAESFQQGRIFLVGDAAHVMPPTGAFGMNTGIQDAQNLAWKLAAVLHGQAGPALLATYDAERRPVAQFTVEQAGIRSDTYVDYYSSEMIDDLAVGLGYRYQSAAVISEYNETASNCVWDLRGQPGTRAPHLWVEHYGRRISTLDLFDTRFVLLAGTDGKAWCHAARKVATALGLPLDAYCVGAAGDLIDLDGNWCSRYGVSSSGAVLIRPDGFVAWRTEHMEKDVRHTLERVLRQLLCKDGVKTSFIHKI